MQPLLASEPTRVGDYRLLARLGKGAMGAVYLARSRGGRVVAIKVIRPDLAEDAEFRERFRREAEMARSVGGFWTAAVVDAEPDADQPWLATEYIPGPTLHKAVVDHGPLPESTVRNLAAGLAEALGAIHGVGLVHRDLKPGNVLLGPDGPRVIDFGISRAMTGQALTATGLFLGTPGFFSPEQTLGGEIGPASDVFSLGAVLVFAATGVGPFGDENTAALLYRVVHSEADVSAVPAGLQPLLAACLAKDPAARPTTTQLLDQLGETTPRGDHWLPPSITAVIDEHATELKQTMDAAPPDTPPPSGVQPKPGTLVYPAEGPSVATAPPPPPPPGAPAPAVPDNALERTNTVRPARPRQTSQQPLDAPRVRKDSPGPVFTTTGRAAALTSAIVLGCLVFGVISFFGTPSFVGESSYLAGVALLTASALLSLCKALMPSLRLKVNSDGLLVSRAGWRREIPWSHVQRVSVVGRGKKQAVTVWFAPSAPVPRSVPWHRLRSYDGGSGVFPIGLTGGWWRRRQESRRVRTALQQYGRGSYDGRLL